MKRLCTAISLFLFCLNAHALELQIGEYNGGVEVIKVLTSKYSNLSTETCPSLVLDHVETKANLAAGNRLISLTVKPRSYRRYEYLEILPKFEGDYVVSKGVACKLK